MDELLQKVKDNLILSHDKDDELLRGYIRAAVSYAESYQHIPSGHYADNPMPPTTEQAVILSCCPPIFTKAGMVLQAASSQIMCRLGSRFGIR